MTTEQLSTFHGQPWRVSTFSANQRKDRIMDPFATIDVLLDAVADGRDDDARWALADLLSWQSHGGFIPRLVDVMSHYTVDVTPGWVEDVLDDE